MEENTLSVLKIAPGKYPQQVEIDNDLKALQQAVGGFIGASYPFEDPVAIVYNDDGKLMGLPLNRALRDEDGRCAMPLPGLSGGGSGRGGFCIPDPGTGAEIRAAFPSAGSLSETGQPSAGAAGADEPPAEKTAPSPRQSMTAKITLLQGRRWQCRKKSITDCP